MDCGCQMDNDIGIFHFALENRDIVKSTDYYTSLWMCRFERRCFALITDEVGQLYTIVSLLRKLI